VLVVVSGQPEPQARPPAPAYHLMTDEGLIEVVSELGGLPPGIEAYPSLLPFMLEPLRADFRLLETYEYRPGPALPCPLLIFGGDADALAPVDRLETWTEAAGVTADVHVLPGGHFFLQDHEERMIATIIRAMSGPAVLYTTTWPATGRRRNDDRQE
jgi:surfactin synthase thioesterase subunit